MDALEMLKTRRSIRAYAPTPISKEIVEDIVDCGRLAATARNEQPCEFVAVTDAAMRAALADLAPNGPFITDAPVCIVVLSRDATYFLEDGSAATQNLLLAARAHGLGSCWVAGDKKPYASRVLQLLNAPEGYKLISMVTIGHSTAQPKPAKRNLAEVLHWERF
ncbi:MAG: nitroreductase family protein [Candidatus Hydrogenedentes bacterium]|nr:nitroreductase family protein [Candidatus Hydrogenedentota bacterium]